MGEIKYIRIVTLLFLAIVAPFFSYSDDSDISFDHYSMVDGLSQNSVTCVFQDSQGFLWIGTHAGLNRFDGRSFKVFKNEPLDPNTIPSNYINAIAEDGSGVLWIATDYGLSRYDKSTGHFASYFAEEDDPRSISGNEVFDVLFDSKGRLWVKTNHALEQYIPEKDEFKKFIHHFNIFNTTPKEIRFPIFEDSEGRIWVGTNDGLNLFDENYSQFRRYFNRGDNSSISNDQIRCIFEDSKHQLWVGTSSGLNLFNKKKNTFEAFYFNKFMPEENSVNSIIEDQEGNLWMGTSSYGLLLFDTRYKLFKSYRHSSNVSSSIANNTVFALYKDASEILWIGTRSGLDKLDVKKKKFQTYRRSAFSPYRFTSNDITAIQAVGDTVLILGTRSKGVNILNLETKKLDIVAKDNSVLGDNSINCILQLHSDSIIVGTDAGVIVLGASDYRPHRFEDVYTKGGKCVLSNVSVSACYEDSQNNVWFGTNLGLVWYSPDDSSLTQYMYKYNDNSSISSNEIHVIFEDSKQNLWIGTSHGLNRMEKEIGIFDRKTFEKNSNKGLSNNTVYSIAEDDIGNLWIATGGGLNKYNTDRDVFSYFTERDGLPNNQIYAILIDKLSLWMSTNKGISKMDLNNGNIKNFGISDGLQGYEFNPNSVSTCKTGQIYFGGINGVNAFIPDSIHENRIVPKVSITSLELINENGKFFYYVEGKDKIELPANNHTFTIEFAALEFTQPLQNNFQYIMEGLDDEWIPIGNRNFANFANIPSGSYVFKVKGSNNDLVWNEEVAQIKIVIATPFYRNRLAYALYVVTIGVLIYLYIEYRTRTLRKANRILLEKQQAAEEIEKQKEELTLKNKNITDSINYAKRIQTAIMPSRKKFKNLIPDSFILYKPKDIVSGDFYWITEIEEKIFVAAVDCTGHGVPGAFMSIIGFDLLRNITKEKSIHSPGEILTYMDNALVDLLSKNSAGGEVKDGMDLSLIVMHKDKGYLEYAGAFNPLYIIRNNRIEVVAADRCSLGASNEQRPVYKNNIVDIEKGDRFYMFSDGYVDQFGGVAGKKMKFRRFRHLLLSIHNLPFDQQEEYLDHYFDKWRDLHEQVDDILIVGMSFEAFINELEELYE